MAVTKVASAARFVVTVGLGGLTALLRGSRLAVTGIGALTSAFGSLLSVLSSVTLAIGIVAGAFSALVLVNASVIDRIGKLQKVIDVSTDTIQKFAFAGEQTGISFDQSTIALRRFARRLGEAQKGTGELLPALRRLGISVRDSDGNLKSVEQVLFEFADGLKNTESETNRLALAFKGFDSEGAELVATLEEGSEKLREFFDEAERLGFVLDAETIRQVEDFNDSFNILVNIVKGAVRQFVGALAPALNIINNDLKDLVSSLTEGENSFKNLGEYLKNQFFNILIDILKGINEFVPAFKRVANFAIEFINKLNFDPKLDGLRETLKILKEFENIEDRDLLDTFSAQDAFDFGKFIGTLKRLAGQLKELGVESEELDKILDLGNMEAYFASFSEEKVGELKKIRDTLLELATPILEIDNLTGGAPIELFDEEQSQRILDIISYLERLRDATGEVEENTEEIKENIEDTRTFAERLADALEIINERIKEFQNTSVNLGDIFDRVAERLGTPLERLQKTLEDGLVKGVEMFEDTLATAIRTGKADFTALGEHIKQVLAKALVQRFITGPILAAFGLAKGGPAKAGQPYIVGEQGPELFVPKQSGTVIPNHEIGNMSGGPAFQGGGQQVTYNINAVDTQSFQQALARDPEFLFAVTQQGAKSLPRS